MPVSYPRVYAVYPGNHVSAYYRGVPVASATCCVRWLHWVTSLKLLQKLKSAHYSVSQLCTMSTRTTFILCSVYVYVSASVCSKTYFDPRPVSGTRRLCETQLLSKRVKIDNLLFILRHVSNALMQWTLTYYMHWIFTGANSVSIRHSLNCSPDYVHQGHYVMLSVCLSVSNFI